MHYRKYFPSRASLQRSPVMRPSKDQSSVAKMTIYQSLIKASSTSNFSMVPADRSVRMSVQPKFRYKVDALGNYNGNSQSKQNSVYHHTHGNPWRIPIVGTRTPKPVLNVVRKGAKREKKKQRIQPPQQAKKRHSLQDSIQLEGLTGWETADQHMDQPLLDYI